MSTSPQFAAAPQTALTVLTNADSTGPKDVFIAGTNGSWVQMWYISHNDTAAVDLIISLYDGTNDLDIDRITLPAATSVTRQKFNILDPAIWTWIDPNNIGIPLESGMKLRLRVGTALTSGKTLNSFVHAGDF